MIAQDIGHLHLSIGIRLRIHQSAGVFDLGVGCRQFRRLDPCIALRRFRVFVPQPLHEFKDREALRGVVEEHGNGGTRAVRSDRTTFIRRGDASLGTKHVRYSE